MNNDLNFEFFLDCYSQGIFPMAESRYDKNISFFRPQKRAIIPLDKVKIQKSLVRSIKKKL